MDSLSQAAIINVVSCAPFKTSLSSPPPHFPLSFNPQSKVRFRVSASSQNPIIEKIQSTSKALIFTAAAALMIGRFSQFPARAESPVPVVEEVEQKQEEEEKKENQELEETEETKGTESPLLEFNSEAIDEMKSLLPRKLEDGEDEEALKISKRLISAEPLSLEWKFLTARLHNKIGEKEEARNVYEEILDQDPLCSDALFQNALIMDQCGEGEAALQMLEERLNLVDENDKGSRVCGLIRAQIQFLQVNVDEALKSYEKLAEEDPEDYRPYFYQFVIYNLLDMNEEAKLQLAKCREVCPEMFRKFIAVDN